MLASLIQGTISAGQKSVTKAGSVGEVGAECVSSTESHFMMEVGARLPKWFTEPLWCRAGGLVEIVRPPVADMTQWNAGEVLVEQHHRFVGPLTGAMYGEPRCNHHIRVLLRLPAPDDAAGAAGAIVPSQAARVDAAVASMAQLLNDAHFYCGRYCGLDQQTSIICSSASLRLTDRRKTAWSNALVTLATMFCIGRSGLCIG